MKEDISDPRQISLRMASNDHILGNHDVCASLNTLLADIFILYVKTKNFHWHMSGPHFRDYHLLLDNQAAELFATTDTIAGRVRKIGGTRLRSVGHIARLQRLRDNDAERAKPTDMLLELHNDGKRLAALLKETRRLCDEHDHVATASLLENWIDEAERRIGFLSEITKSD